MSCLPGTRAVEASMPGKSTLTADAVERAALRALSKSEQRGEADRARAILLTLEGQKAEEIAAVLGVHVSTVRNWRGYGGARGQERRPRLDRMPGRSRRRSWTTTRATTAAGRCRVCVPRLPGAADQRSRRGGSRINCAKGVCLPAAAPYPQRAPGHSGGRGQPRAPCRSEDLGRGGGD